MESGRYWNDSTDYLEHHGVLGMKWGVRRYQNEDGSLTDKGKKRYNIGGDSATRRASKKYDKAVNAFGKAEARYNKTGSSSAGRKSDKAFDKSQKAWDKYEKAKKRSDAKGYQRHLNDLDEQYVHDNSNRIWNHNLGDSNARKYNKLTAKGKDEKAAKVLAKVHQNVKDETMYKKLAEDSEKQTRKLLAEANQKGFDINSKECRRYEHAGSEFTAWFVGGTPLGVASISVDMPDHMDTRGRSYKVRKSKNSVGTTTLKSRS